MRQPLQFSQSCERAGTSWYLLCLLKPLFELGKDSSPALKFAMWDFAHTSTGTEVPKHPKSGCGASNSDDVEARVMFWVLIGFLILAVIVGLALGLAFGWIPLPWKR